MIKTMILFELRKYRKELMIWLVSIMSVMSLYTILFPSIQDLAQAKFDSLPKELLQFVGMDGFSDMTHYNKYFFIIVSIVLIAIALFAATFPSKIVLSEEKQGTIEYLYSHPITRQEIIIVKTIVSVFAVLALIVGAVIPGLINGFLIGGETFNAWNLFLVGLSLSIIPLFFLSLSLFIGASVPKMNGIAVLAVMITYVLGYLSKLLEMDILKVLSPFEFFSAVSFQNPSNGFWMGLLGYGVLIVGGLILAIYLYGKRDFEV